MDTPYTAHLRVGDHTWDIDSTDPADYGPTAPIRFGWEAPTDDGWPTQHDPTILAFGVVVPAGTDFDEVDQGTWVHYTFTPDGYAAPLVEFGGTVRDLVGRPHPLGMVYAITAVDALLALKDTYRTTVFLPSATAIGTVWANMVQAMSGGEGTLPTLPDPLAGKPKPDSGGFTSSDLNLAGSTWDLLTRFAAAVPFFVGSSPHYQRVLLGYQLDGSGDLDAAAPYVGDWYQMGPSNAPQWLVEGPDGWTVGGGQVDGCLMPTDAAEWQRLRDEPNVVKAADGSLLAVRPHTGSDIVRTLGDAPLAETDPFWIVGGVEPESQWSSELQVIGSIDPESVAGWFTLPSATSLWVACRDIDQRHTPDGSGIYVGMLAAASLVVDAGGRWTVSFRLRRTIPDTSGANGAGTAPAASLTWADLDPDPAWADLDPDLSWADLWPVGPTP